MTNVRKLVARLNASTCRFDMGRGGIPELTPQDIAAALGMVQDELAREVFCAIWWPDGARLAAKGLDQLIARLQFAEWRRRADRLIDAQLALAMARADGDEDAIYRGESLLSAAVAQMWPTLAQDAYADVRAAVLDELRYPDLCESCKGAGDILVGGRMTGCTACGGSGREPRSSRKRAGTSRIEESAYRRVWRHVYEWTLSRAQSAEGEGGRILAARLAG